MQKLVLTIAFIAVFVGIAMPSGMVVSPAPATASSEQIQIRRTDTASAAAQANVDLGTGAITLEREPDGHFYADAKVNGAPVRFLVDTGATGIALTRDDAQRSAVPMAPMLDDIVGRGASGAIRGTFVTLDQVSLGLKEVRGAQAAVLAGGDQSLLGQSFLSQFGSVTIEGDRMVLR